MRTLTIKQGGSSWATGWHTLTVSTAKYGNVKADRVDLTIVAIKLFCCPDRIDK